MTRLSEHMPLPTRAQTENSSACVFYDGACPLCRAEIAAYQKADRQATLRWVDASSCSSEALGPDLQRQVALARLHVRRADGTLVQGAAAFIEVWSALPRWRVLARLARWPGALPLMDLVYAVFLKLRPLWRPQRTVASGLRDLERELRTDHAGETGAVMIYRGVLSVSRDPDLRAFAAEHLATERRHLEAIEQVLLSGARSRLLPLWRLSGWLTGALPALVGPRAVYATIEAVETFVDRHYAAQLELIDAVQARLLADARPDADVEGDARGQFLAGLRDLLAACRGDEVLHRDQAAARWDGRGGPVLRLWRAMVRHGSAAAVSVCRIF